MSSVVCACLSSFTSYPPCPSCLFSSSLTHLNRVPRIPAPHFPYLSHPRSRRMSSASLTPHSANLSPHFSTRWAVSNFTKKLTPTAWVREGGEREMRE